MTPIEDEPIDEQDLLVLEGLRELYQRVDPMPGDLADRIQFALSIETFDTEVLQRTAVPEPLAAVRGGDERTRTITFDGESLTIMLAISTSSGTTVRLDGWLAPAMPREVELRTEDGSLTASADQYGRFVLEGVPAGLAQLVVHPNTSDPAGSRRTVVTPAIVL